MWMAENNDTGAQPVGFATPVATPLGDYQTAGVNQAGDDVVLAPVDYAVDANRGPALDQVAPAPPANRDPRQPFVSGQADQMPTQQVRDPRQPIVTESFTGQNPDFAPPTGKPVVPGGRQPAHPSTPAQPVWGARMPVQPAPWASQPGNVGAIARPVVGPPVGQPYVMPAGRPMPNHPVYAAPASPEQALRDHYRKASDGLGKFGVVMSAVPWPALLVLLIGVAFGGAWLYLYIIAWIIATSNAKIAKRAIMTCFWVVIAVMVVVWAVSMIATSFGVMGASGAYLAILRWCCAGLLIALPVVAWRGLEST